MWSVGAIIYRLLTPGATRSEVHAAKRGSLELNIKRGGGSNDVIQTVRRLLSKNPSRRYCAADTLHMKWIEAAVVAPFRMRLPRRALLPEYLPRFLRAETFVSIQPISPTASITQRPEDEQRQEAGEAFECQS